MIKQIKASELRVGDSVDLGYDKPCFETAIVISTERKGNHTVAHTDMGPFCRYHDSVVFIHVRADEGVTAFEKASVIAATSANY